jgi:hypothetical protein
MPLETVMELLSENNAKTPKGEKLGYLTGIMYLIPDENLCPMSGPNLAACREPCLVSAGRGKMASVQSGRQRKTDLFYSNPTAFLETLEKDIATLVRRAERRSMAPVVRLNGTSDIAWENQRFEDGTNLMERFPDVQFMDYTKMPGRKVPDNYDLTVSYSGANVAYANKCLAQPRRIAVVFRGEKPLVWNGKHVVDGDAHDLRFIEPEGVVVGLKAKGDALRDDSGFVVDIGG